MQKEQFVTIEGKRVPIEGEKNLLELVRKANFNIMTFCYHPELAAYGACRLCLVEVEGMGIVASCTVAPKDGMKVRVNSDEIRHLRRINLELLLSSGNHDCTLCSKSNNCKLQKLAKDMDVTEIRFKSKKLDSHKDATSAALVRDHIKCILCGNCVRICNEVQGIGAIDFAFRGFRSKIATAFNKELGQSHECVSCGQCARVCPTGALMPNFIDECWQLLSGAGAAGVRLAGDFLLEIAKTIRGYGGASIFASQDLADFFDLDGGRFGKGIINNSKTKIILNLEDDEAQRVQEALHLSDAETMEITHFERGHGLISTNNNNIMVEFKASPLEKDLITTDRRELREIVERKRREQSTSAEQQI